jgi:hypothetical protein
MTPAQMAKRLPFKPAWEQPQPPTAVDDFAQSANLSVYACVKQKTCPICGSKGSMEHYTGSHPQSFFFCDNSGQHIYELDDDAGFADRVPM